MTTFTAVELDLLEKRMRGAASGLQRELSYRRHPLTGPLPHDRRYDLADLVRLHHHYARLAGLTTALQQGQALPEIFLAGSDLLRFLAEELALTYAAAAYVTAQPFSWRTRAGLLRTLDIEARFFKLVIDQLQQMPYPTQLNPSSNKRSLRCSSI